MIVDRDLNLSKSIKFHSGKDRFRVRVLHSVQIGIHWWLLKLGMLVIE